MKTVSNFRDALSGDMEMYVAEAISAAQLADDAALDGVSLGAIREQLYVLGRERRSQTKGKSDAPIGEAITLTERLGFHPGHWFWTAENAKITYQLMMSGDDREGVYTWLAQSPAGVPYDEAGAYLKCRAGDTFKVISREEYIRARKEIKVRVVHERHHCGSIYEMVDWANSSTPGNTH